MLKKRQRVVNYPHSHPGAQVATLSWEYADGQFVEEHFHNEDQLVFASQGVMTVQTQEGVWIVPPLRAVWIPGKIVHSIRMSGTVSMRTLYFVPKFAKALPPKCFVMSVSPLLRELILHTCQLGKLTKDRPREKRVLEMILDQLDERETMPLQLPIPSDPRAKRIAEALLKDPSDKRLLDQLCEQCGASKRTIERLFLEETHLTVGKWRQQLRMLLSLRLLASGQKVTYVALESGYSTPSAFISAFRKTLGKTPSHYCEGNAT